MMEPDHGLEAGTHSGALTYTGPLSDWTFDPLRPLADGVALLNAQTPLTDRSRRNLEQALATIESQEREAFLQRHRDRFAAFDPFGPVKYADFPFWVHHQVEVAQRLDLDRVTALDILDIGMGPGNFVMVANSMGHRAVGTDVADPWYDELCALAGSERVIAPVEAGVPYRPIDRRFDLITIMLPVFHRRSIKRKRHYWPVEHWRQFLHGLAIDMLKPGGRIFILMPLDKADDGTLSYSPLLAWSQARGARLINTRDGEPIRHILFENVDAAQFAA
ncbi:class I SAM-dependent methyltransferase [Croceicoccus ponticola]|uniref:Class I SAM-dependent methyltransferase n=1 Tax=Croceicoccus ponticola TaxID=2217664 RepID=A0A437GWN8_9SPHN|nr:class I SAM-dependent methyltransferase [Croceicoccus ponticola]RVQ66532.1 class I SAM-dependent methyltransferase [Croceicoccus ponticola]